jgi:phospholipid/cholesterol/gamma-HCH transport system substrate-binding protein
MNAKDFFTPFKVGLLVIVGLAATFVMITRFTGDGGGAGSEYVELYVMFDDVTGLAKRSRISMSGIPVGEIADIKLDGKRARVDILVRSDLTIYEGIEDSLTLKRRDDSGQTVTVEIPYYKNGATVAKKSASLIGDYYLELTPGTEGSTLSEGGQIRNVNEGVSVEEIFRKLNNITGDIEQVTASLAAVLGGEDGQKGLQKMLTDTQEILSTTRDFVVESKPKFDAVVDDAKVVSGNLARLSVTGTESIDIILADAQEVVRDVKSVTQEVKFIVGQSSGDVQAGLGSIAGTLLRLQSTLDSLNYSLQNVQDITDKVNEGEGTLGALVNDPTIADKTSQVLGDVSDVTDTIGRLRTVVSFRSEYHLNNGQLKSIVGLKLQPRRNKYYLIEIVDAYRGLRANSTEIVRDEDGNEIDTIQRTTISDDYKLSIQYAIGNNLTDWLAWYFRFGVIESRGGIGGNLVFFEDRSLELQADLYEFDEGRNPRLRVFGSYNVFPNLYLFGGIDDALNDYDPALPLFGRQFTLGLGFALDDRDLKGLFTVSGVPTP